MAELMDIMKGRRSVRKFKSDPVPTELIDKIMEAGIWAASGMNRQDPIVIAVTDKAVRDKIAEANRKIAGGPEGSDPFYGAPVILVVAAGKSAPTAVYDGSLTLGNMMLMTHELGLGGVWIHRCKEEFENGLGQELLDMVGVKGDYIGIGHLAVGYIDGAAPATLPRKGGRMFHIG